MISRAEALFFIYKEISFIVFDDSIDMTSLKSCKNEESARGTFLNLILKISVFLWKYLHF